MNTEPQNADTGDAEEKPDDVKIFPANRAWFRRNRARPAPSGLTRTHTLRFLPSAREWFTILRPEMLAARPIIGRHRDGTPIYGRSTYRNVAEDDQQ